jgi:hypothetical protein
VGRVGVYPGSFNPPTVAHLAIAEAARDERGLARLVLSVSRSALAKEHVEHPPFEVRIEVLEASVAHLAWVEVRVTDRQLLVDIAEGFDLLVLGADKWRQIQDPAWYGDDPARRDAALARLPEIAVVPRDDIDVPVDLALHVPSDAIDGVSSTRARSGDLDLMTPAARAFAHLTGAWLDGR